MSTTDHQYIGPYLSHCCSLTTEDHEKNLSSQRMYISIVTKGSRNTRNTIIIEPFDLICKKQSHHRKTHKKRFQIYNQMSKCGRHTEKFYLNRHFYWKGQVGLQLTSFQKAHCRRRVRKVSLSLNKSFHIFIDPSDS